MARWLVLTMMVAAAGGLVSCKRMTSRPARTAQAASRPAHGDQLYIEISALGGIDYFYDHKLGMQMAGEALGVRTEYVGPADYDMAAMVTALEQAIARKPAGLVVVGFEPSLSAIVDKAVAAGIPVVTVDADLPGSKRVAFVGTGNVRAGQEMGRALARQIGGRGKVVVLLKPGQSNLEERRAGLEQALKAFPDIQIVQAGDTQSDPIVAAQVAGSLLQKHPDLAGFACVEAAGGAGAATAVKEAGKAGQVKIVAMDRGADVLGYVREGVIQVTVAQQTALMPFYAVQILYNLRNSPVPISNDNARAGVSGAPASIDTGVILIDKTNCEHFLRAPAKAGANQ